MIIPSMMRPMMMQSGKVPFSLSGSWETGNEDWTLVSRAVRTNYAPAARTGTWFMYSTGGGDGTLTLTYTVPADVAGGLTITASVYAAIENTTANLTRSIAYQIGSGSFVTLQSVTNNTTGYSLLTGEFDNPGDDDITIRIQGQILESANSNYSRFDDWSISGS